MCRGRGRGRLTCRFAQRDAGIRIDHQLDEFPIVLLEQNARQPQLVVLAVGKPAPGWLGANRLHHSFNSGLPGPLARVDGLDDSNALIQLKSEVLHGVHRSRHPWGEAGFGCRRLCALIRCGPGSIRDFKVLLQRSRAPAQGRSVMPPVPMASAGGWLDPVRSSPYDYLRLLRGPAGRRGVHGRSRRTNSPRVEGLPCEAESDAPGLARDLRQHQIALKFLHGPAGNPIAVDSRRASGE